MLASKDVFEEAVEDVEEVITKLPPNSANGSGGCLGCVQRRLAKKSIS